MVVSLGLLVLMVSQTLNHQWSSDFWEHAAVVRELATHPFDPGHPLAATDDPHPFYSPWSVAVGLGSKVVGIGPVGALSVMAIIHLVVFLAGLSVFVRKVSPHRYAPVLALLATLLLWGWRPWRYSGFLHLNSLGFVMPFPSLFATGLLLWGLVLFVVYLERRSPIALAGLVAVSWVVLLTHSITAVVLYLGMAAFAWGHPARRPADLLMVAGVAAASGLLALLWPYYPILDLARSRAFDRSNQAMYESTIVRTFPALLIGIPALFRRWRVNHRDPLATLAVALLAVFVVGDLVDRWSYGRVVAGLVLVLHVAAADLVAGQLPAVRGYVQRRRPAARFLLVATVGAVLVAALANVAPGLVRTVPASALPASLADEVDREEDPYRFLSDVTDQYDVVLAEREPGWLVPTYGGKIVTSWHPWVFIDDSDQRASDVRRFFARGINAPARQRIIDRYRAEFVLIDATDVRRGSGLYRSLVGLGSVVHDDDGLVLVELDR